MKPTEWTFKIPNILKEETRLGKVSFSVAYSLDELKGINITLKVHKNELQLDTSEQDGYFNARDERLEHLIRDFIYRKVAK